jgi:DNA-binding transcriptional regulator/RsmH inhibitor MraZ
VPDWMPIILAPNGVGDAPCDEKWRVRLPSHYAAYFLAFEPDRATAKMYAVTFDGEDILLWPKMQFSQWRQRLLESPEADRHRTRQLLAATQFYGGETEIDRQGRFVLPRTVREALHLEGARVDFKVFNDGPVRLTTKERLEAAKRDFAPLGRELDDYAVDQYTRLSGQRGGDQGGSS